jgi:hypothetical protein
MKLSLRTGMALSALVLGTLVAGDLASAASLGGSRMVQSPVPGTLVDPVGYRGGGVYLSIGPGYYYDDDYEGPYGYRSYGSYPGYGYSVDDDDDDDDYHYRRHGRHWAKERFEHPLGRR